MTHHKFIKENLTNVAFKKWLRQNKGVKKGYEPTIKDLTDYKTYLRKNLYDLFRYDNPFNTLSRISFNKDFDMLASVPFKTKSSKKGYSYFIIYTFKNEVVIKIGFTDNMNRRYKEAYYRTDAEIIHICESNSDFDSTLQSLIKQYNLKKVAYLNEDYIVDSYIHGKEILSEIINNYCISKTNVFRNNLNKIQKIILDNINLSLENITSILSNVKNEYDINIGLYSNIESIYNVVLMNKYNNIPLSDIYILELSKMYNANYISKLLYLPTHIVENILKKYN